MWLLAYAIWHIVPPVNTSKNSETSNLVGEIRAEMARQKLTLANVTQATDISRTSLSRKLNGSYEFTIKELFQISTFLGVPFSELLRRAEQVAA